MIIFFVKSYKNNSEEKPGQSSDWMPPTFSTTDPKIDKISSFEGKPQHISNINFILKNQTIRTIHTLKM